MARRAVSETDNEGPIPSPEAVFKVRRKMDIPNHPMP